MPAVDFMVGRAGGGSVNDAVACRIPFVCVEELGQTQVELILKACEAKKLTRRIRWRRFQREPVQVARSQWEKKSNRLENRQFVMRLREIPSQTEKWLVQELFRALS